MPGIKDFNYQIAIPSRSRAGTIARTLGIIDKSKLPMSRVHVFIRNADFAPYFNALNQLGIKLIVVPPGESTGHLKAEGLGATRNFMRRYFPKGEKILYMDDDIRGLWIMEKKGKSKPFNEGLDVIARHGFLKCMERRAALWGIYPVDNPYFASNKTSVDLKYIIGALYGEINDPAPEMDVTTDDKEDFERTILHFRRYGHVIRINRVGMRTVYYAEMGGMQDYRTEESNEIGGRYLIKRYPQYCEINRQRKEHFEIKLKRL